MELDLMQQLDYRLMVPLSEIDNQLAILGISLSKCTTPQLRPRHGQKRAGHAHSPSVELPSKALEVSTDQSHIAPAKTACASLDAEKHPLKPSTGVNGKAAELSCRQVH